MASRPPSHRGPGRTQVTFTTSPDVPALVYEACLKTGTPSNTAYYQRAVAAALARDLGLDYDQLVANLPPTRGPSGHLFGTPSPMSRSNGRTFRLDQEVR